jgi:hypothetical protein
MAQNQTQAQETQGIDALVKELVEKGDIVFERGRDGLEVIYTLRVKDSQSRPIPMPLTLRVHVVVDTKSGSEMAGFNPPLTADFAAAIGRFIEQHCEITPVKVEPEPLSET